MANETEPLIDIKEVAVRLGLKVRQVRTLVYRKVIPVLRLGHRTLRFRWSEVEQAVNRYRQKEIS
jgi:excisionase family DNA binding protein